jgi:hypothetical protein
MEDYIVSILITIFITAIVYAALKYWQPSTSSIQGILTTIQDGRKEINYSSQISPSNNQSDGLTFAYAGWVLIDDFTYRYGEKKVIFSKGTPDLKITCPALVLDSQNNSFLVYIDTFGAQEVIPISNIPAKKWIHFVIVVDQTSADIYINGTLHTHHTMNQLPRQNTSNLLIAPGGGFSGKIGLIQYYPNSLKPSDVSALSLTAPQQDSSDIGVLPPYFDTKWWLGSDRRSKI